MKKKRNIPLESFAQGVQLYIVLIPIQRDLKIRIPAKILYVRILKVSCGSA